MATLKEDIEKSSQWIVKAFAEDKIVLDYSIDSFIEIDKFFLKHSTNGKANKGGRLSGNLGAILFSLGAYIGNSIIKNVPGTIWETDDNDPQGEINISLKFPDNVNVWPVQRTMRRFSDGVEDSIYVYGYQLTNEWTKQQFNSNYWDSIKEEKPWWKFGH